MEMKNRIDIENFQSISEAHLEFDPGITVISGSSNSGKTAILRALNALIQNPRTGRYYIKTGEKLSRVTFSYDDHQLVWERTPTETRYIIDNGSPNKKCGKSDIYSFVPSFPIVREEDGSILNIHGEFDILFPFRYSPPEMFKLFERIMSLDDTASVIKAMNSDSTYFAQKRLQDTTGKANVDRAVEEQEEVVRAFERRQERRERKECVEETLLEDVSETRSLSLQFWKLQEFTEQLSSLSLSLNTFKLLKEIVREYKGIGECEGKGGNPQETCGVERYLSPPICCVEKLSIETATGTSHQIQIQHVTSNRNNQPVPVWGARPCDAKDTSGYPHNAGTSHQEQICSNPRVGGASSFDVKDTSEVSTQRACRDLSGYPNNAPESLEASDLISQTFDEVDGIMRTCVGLYRPLESCRDLQGARDALRAVPTPIEPLSDLCEASRSLVGALEGVLACEETLMTLRVLPEAPTVVPEVLQPLESFKALFALQKAMDRISVLNIPKTPQCSFSEEDVVGLIRAVESLESVSSRLEKTEAELVSLRSEYRQVEAELSEYDLCPLCGSKLEEDQCV